MELYFFAGFVKNDHWKVNLPTGAMSVKDKVCLRQVMARMVASCSGGGDSNVFRETNTGLYL
jgi:hypothetical protein